MRFSPTDSAFNKTEAMDLRESLQKKSDAAQQKLIFSPSNRIPFPATLDLKGA